METDTFIYAWAISMACEAIALNRISDEVVRRNVRTASDMLITMATGFTFFGEGDEQYFGLLGIPGGDDRILGRVTCTARDVLEFENEAMAKLLDATGKQLAQFAEGRPQEWSEDTRRLMSTLSNLFTDANEEATRRRLSDEDD